MRLWNLQILVMVILSTLTACSADTQGNGVTSTYTTSTQLNSTPEKIRAPFQTSTQTSTSAAPHNSQPETESQPTILPPSSTFVGKDFLFGERSQQCQLPCWHTIQIGKSTRVQAQEVLKNTFGIAAKEVELKGGLPEQHRGILYSWELPRKPLYDESFGTLIVFDKTTNILNGMNFNMRGTKYFLYVSPERVIRELGAPDSILISLEAAGQGDDLHVNMILDLIYLGGLGFYYIDDLPYDDSFSTKSLPSTTQLCLNKGYHPEVSIAITSPIENITTLSPVQTSLFGDIQTLHTMNELVGVSPSEVANMILQKGKSCLPVTIPN